MRADLTGLSADIDLRAYSSNGTELDSSLATGSASDRVDFTVAAGQTYYLRVDPDGNAASKYNLVD